MHQEGLPLFSSKIAAGPAVRLLGTLPWWADRGNAAAGVSGELKSQAVEHRLSQVE